MKIHKKLYKSGKQWCVLTIAVTTTILSLSFLAGPVSADGLITNESNDCSYNNVALQNNQKLVLNQIQNYSQASSDDPQPDDYQQDQRVAWIKIIDENDNKQLSGFNLRYDQHDNTIVKGSYDENGTPVYQTIKNTDTYKITAPSGYYFDTNYFAPSNSTDNNYDKIRSPYYSSVNKESLDFNFKHALSLDGLLSKGKPDTFNLWVVKDGDTPKLSLTSDKVGQKEERIDWYSNDSGEYVGSQKFYISDLDTDMSKAVQITAPKGQYFYTDYETEFGYRNPTSGYVYNGNNYYPPIDLNGQKFEIIDGKKCYKTGILHLYDAIKEGYFNKDNYNCNSTSLHIFRLWIFDPNYKKNNSAPLRDNGSSTPLGGAEVKYVNSYDNSELSDYNQIWNGNIGDKIELKLKLPTMANREWVIDGNKMDVNEIPSTLTLSEDPNPLTVYVMLKDNTSTVKFFGEDGFSTPILLNGKRNQDVYVRDRIIKELAKLAEKGYRLPTWYNQSSHIIEASEEGNNRVTSYVEVPSYIRLEGNTDIFNSYKNTPIYIKVEKAKEPSALKYVTIDYVDENGNPVEGLSKIIYNFDSKGNYLQSVTIPDNFYSIPDGYDYITGMVHNCNFNNKNIRIVAHKNKVTQNAWRYINGHWYYFGANGKRYHHRLAKIDGNIYVFNDDGTIKQAEWYEHNGQVYYLGANGIAYRNCFGKVEGNLYAFNNDGSIKRSEWYEHNGQVYYLGANGIAYRNCFGKVEGNLYAFNNDGSIKRSEWYEHNGQRYYLGANGVAYRNCTCLVNGTQYTFNDDGVSKTI